MLTGYLDESEQKDAGIFAIGGYLFDKPGQRRFAWKWRRALASKNLIRFHMSDFENRRGEFRNWPERARVPFQQHLIGIIRDTCLAEISVALDLQAFSALKLTDRKLLGAYSPYTFCLRLCIEVVAAHLIEKMESQETVQYVADQVGPNVGKGILIDGFAALLKNLNRNPPLDGFRLGIPPVTWADSRSVPHLQAADMWAYEAAKVSATFLKRTERDPRASLRMLMLPPERSVDHLIDAERLGLIVETMTKSA